MRADLESGRDSRCDQPYSFVDSVEIPRLNVPEDPLDPAFDRRFYIFTLRGCGFRYESCALGPIGTVGPTRLTDQTAMWRQDEIRRNSRERKAVPRMNESITTERRQELFLRLVNEQDAGKNVEHSRSLIGDAFGISEPEVRNIEREGLDKQWPPL